MYDVVIIGAGIAGLSVAMNLPESLKVLVLCKDEPTNCNTQYAQGGIAVSLDAADVDSHIEDTLKAGAGHCDRERVRILCEESREAIDDLIVKGLPFDTDSEGNLLYTREGAHSHNRVLHCDGDGTGKVMLDFLLKQNPHELMQNVIVTDLHVEEGSVVGIEMVVDGKAQVIQAHHVVIASGGVGALYAYNTNAKSISGDLQGICIEKGIAMRDMEMMQFHPTVFVNNDWARKFLLSEALRGEGAHIVNQNNAQFLQGYDPRGDLAPRDVVSRAMYDYQRKSGEDAYLSVRDFSKSFIKKRFPNIYFNLTELGFHLPEDLIPISPAFHYAMGGIKTDENGRTESMQNLYAVGECACTGVHGANRLASNSLLEGLVYGRRVARKIIQSEVRILEKKLQPKSHVLKEDGDKEVKNELRELLWQSAGIIRNLHDLRDSEEKIREMLSKRTGRMVQLRLIVALEIIQSAMRRTKPLGAHYIT